MKKDEGIGTILLILIGATIWFAYSWYSRGQELTRLNNALDDANSRIEQMDMTISDAKGAQGSSYREMYDAIDNLAPSPIVDSSSPVYAP